MAGQIHARIRKCIGTRKYELTRHAVDEMAEDELNLLDVQQSILLEKIVKIETDELRGRKYIIHGTGSTSFAKVGMVGRFIPGDRYLIITVYAI